MNDVLDIRLGRLCLQLYAAWPVVRVGWNPIPTLLKDFGWMFLWVRGFGVVVIKRDSP